MARRQVPQIPEAIRVAQEAVTTTEQRRDALQRSYDDALAEAIQQQRARLQVRPAVYSLSAVIIEDEQVALLRKQLDAAIVAVTEAQTARNRIHNYFLTLPGGIAS
jgi:hypothetical protein